MQPASRTPAPAWATGRRPRSCRASSRRRRTCRRTRGRAPRRARSRWGASRGWGFGHPSIVVPPSRSPRRGRTEERRERGVRDRPLQGTPPHRDSGSSDLPRYHGRAYDDAMKKPSSSPSPLLMTMTTVDTAEARRGAARTRAGAAPAGAAHRRPQRLPLGRPRERRTATSRSSTSRSRSRRSTPTSSGSAQGGVGAQFWSVYVPSTCRASRRHRHARADRHRPPMLRKWPDAFELALTADDVERIFKAGRSRR
jgi:hypothetical protein